MTVRRCRIFYHWPICEQHLKMLRYQQQISATIQKFFNINIGHSKVLNYLRPISARCHKFSLSLTNHIKMAQNLLLSPTNRDSALRIVLLSPANSSSALKNSSQLPTNQRPAIEYLPKNYCFRFVEFDGRRLGSVEYFIGLRPSWSRLNWLAFYPLISSLWSAIITMDYHCT